MTDNNVPTLHQWFTARLDEMEASSYFAKDAWKQQIMFVRDNLPYMLGCASHQAVTVHSTHCSKSTELPVYTITTAWGVIEARNNYYNWTVCIELNEGQHLRLGSDDFVRMYAGSSYLGFEGMVRQYPAWPDAGDSGKFAFSCFSDYALYSILAYIHCTLMWS